MFKLTIRINGDVRRFSFDHANDAAMAVHRTAKKLGYVCLVDYQGDEPMLRWTIVRLADNHTVGRASVEQTRYSTKSR